MIKFTPRRIEWKTIEHIHGNSEVASTFSHSYNIHFDSSEKMYKVTYLNYRTLESDYRYEVSMKAAKNWVENTHYPAQFHRHFDVIK